MDGYLLASIATLLFSCTLGLSAQIKTEVHLDKDHYVAGEPVFVVWEYTNSGSTPMPFDRFDAYCPMPTISAPSLEYAAPPVFPYPVDALVDCEAERKPLQPGEKYLTKFLLNHRFKLSRPGKYDLTVPMERGVEALGKGNLPATENISLILEPSGERELRKIYQPYFDALDSDGDKGYPGRHDAVRVLADSSAPFTESQLLRFSSDPRTGSDVQAIANEGLGRLKTPAACARLAELADHAELHHQQTAIEQLGQCDDPSYMQFLFQLADRDHAMHYFAVLAAGEIGGDGAVDRLLNLASPGSLDRENAFVALGRTGSKRAVKAIVDALPSLQEGPNGYAALSSLTTLTHHESREKEFGRKVQQWRQWWEKSQNEPIYKPRDWRVLLTSLN